MAVSKRLRFEVLRRDNHACRYCGAAAPDAKLHVDHVIPQSLGGPDHPTNLVTACTDCNAGKTSSMPGAATVADVDQDTFRQAAELKQKAEQQTRSRVDKAVLELAFTIWHYNISCDGKTPPAQQEDEFRQSLAELSDIDLMQPERIIEAAQCAAWTGISNMAAALREMDYTHVWHAWNSAWPTTYVSDPDSPWGGRYVGGPDSDATARAEKRIRKLLDTGVSVSRATWAAAYAGFHKSERIYRDFADEELEASGQDRWWRSRAVELWRVAFTASGEREPSPEEIARFFACLDRACEVGGFYIADLHEAAAAAGSYQDPDLTTCLPRHGSVFEAAAFPLPIP